MPGSDTKWWYAIVIVACLLSQNVQAAPPTVDNVRAQQRDDQSKRVDIFYTVSDPDNDSVTVTVEVTANGSAIEASSISGDIGEVECGSDRRIVWDAGADWDGEYSDNVVFTVTADDGSGPSVQEGMVLIPGGTNSGTDPDFGAYTLTVTSFYMDKYEVTKTLWDAVKNWNGGNGYTYDTTGHGKASNHPVQTVTWYDCVKWCNARSEKEGRMPVYYTDAELTQIYKTGYVLVPYVSISSNGYRLPTEEQWEYAARGGVAGRRFPWGEDTIQHVRANYHSSASYSFDTSSTRGYHPDWDDGGSPYTSPVGTFEMGKNGYGLYDMAGNVAEWCYDWYPGREGQDRVLHGGSWSYDGAYYGRVANRAGSYWNSAGKTWGFRTCLLPSPTVP